MAKEFGAAFHDADELIITGIYSAGEKPINGVSSSLITDEARKYGKKVVFIEKKEDVPDYIINKVKSGDYILTIGAGDISDTAYELVEKLKSTFHEEVIGNIPEVN